MKPDRTAEDGSVSTSEEEDGERDKSETVQKGRTDPIASSHEVVPFSRSKWSHFQDRKEVMKKDRPPGHTRASRELIGNFHFMLSWLFQLGRQQMSLLMSAHNTTIPSTTERIWCLGYNAHTFAKKSEGIQLKDNDWLWSVSTASGQDRLCWIFSKAPEKVLLVFNYFISICKVHRCSFNRN